MEKELSEKELDKKVEKISQKFSLWLKDKHNLIFFIMFLILFGINLYYFFNFTKSQPFWWDEADYMNMAKTWLGADYWDLKADIVRPILFPAIISIFLVLGLGESAIRLFVIFTLLISVMLLYGIGKLLFDKKIALISSFILGAFWSFTFWSHRILVDVPVTMLWLATIYFFFDAYTKDQGWKNYAVAGVFLGLSFLMKYSSITLVAIFAFYLITTEKFKAFKNKKLWIFFIVSLLTVLPLFAYQYFNYGNPLQFNKVVAETGNPQANNFQDNFNSLMRQIPFMFKVIYPAAIIFFVLGILWIFFYMFILKKQVLTKKTKANSYYFLLLWIVFSLIFFARLISSDTAYLDERYYFVFYPAIFLIVGVGLGYLFKTISKYSFQAAFLVIIAILLFSAYQNIIHANEIINKKKDSYIQLKLAGEFVKQNTAPEDYILILEEQAEISYYSERKFIHLGLQNSSFIEEAIKTYKPKYAVLSFLFSASSPEYYEAINYVFSHPEIFKSVQSYGPYINKEQTLPLAVVFEIQGN